MTQEDEAKDVREIEAAKAARGGGPRRPCLLVVDDDGIIREMLRVSLESRYDVVCRSNGENVIHALEEVRPNLIILDINLPGGDGHKVCERVRSVAKYRSLPVLFMTVRKDNAAFLQSLQSGGDALIVKPFEIAALRERVEYLLKSHLAN